MNSIFFIIVCFFFSTQVQAQTVLKVTGNEVLVDTDGNEDFSQGNNIHIIDSDLNISGQGKVKKVSAGGSKILIELESGSAKKGMTIEKVKVSSERSHRRSESTKTMTDSYRLFRV